LHDQVREWQEEAAQANGEARDLEYWILGISGPRTRSVWLFLFNKVANMSMNNEKFKCP
jgi:hypothetical protein